MAWNSSQIDIMEARRRTVAALRRQRLTMRQIAATMAKQNEKTPSLGFVNPDNGKPWDLKTIKRDLDYLQAQARKEALKDTLEHRTEILADYHELLRLHWQKGQLESVRKVLADMRAMLGTDAPQVIIYEQLVGLMTEGAARLHAEFIDEPEIYERAKRALSGELDISVPELRDSEYGIN